MPKLSWSHLSLSQRLLVGALLWVLCSLVVAGWLLTQLFKNHIEQQLYKELNVNILQLISQMEQDEKDQLVVQAKPAEPRFEQPLSGWYWQIQAQGATTPEVYSRSLWDESLHLPLLAPEADIQTQIDDPLLGHLYVLGRSVALLESETEPHYQVWVAAQSEEILEPLQRFISMLMLTLVVLGTVLVVGVWWQLRLGLKPLHQLQVQLALVHEGKTETIGGNYPLEIQPLVSEFNRVLQSNAEVVQRARTQAGNLAHAIKTPLAVLANAAKSDDSSLGQLVQDQVITAQQQVDYHLSRARVAAAFKTIGRRSLVAPAIATLIQVLKQAYSTKSVSVQVHYEEPNLYFMGEVQDLHELLGNVLDNAFKWARSTVHIRVRRLSQPTGGARLEICIEDDGQGLSPQQCTAVFKRGVRADEIAPGSGLGLAIVADLVQLYGGQVNATRSALGGLRVTLYLP